MQEDEKVFGRKYLAILQKLVPMRLACAGGPVSREANQEDKDFAKGDRYQAKPDDHIECSICLNDFDDARATTCGHIYCKECIEGVITGMDSSTGPCPICRRDISLKTLKHVVFPNVEVPKEEKQESDGEPDIVFKSKFDVLLRELRSIRDKDSEGKCNQVI